MKKVKMFALIALVFSFIACWAIGCTGGEIITNVSPVPSASPSPSGVPTGTPTTVLSPLGKTITQAETGTNIFNLALWGNAGVYPYVKLSTTATGKYSWVSDLFWVSRSSNPAGKLSMDTVQRAASDIITGLNNPMAFLIYRESTDTTTPANNEDYIFIAEDQNPGGGAIYRYLKDKNGIGTPVTLVSGLLGEIPYMTFGYKIFGSHMGDYLYYVRNAGGSNSSVERVNAFDGIYAREILYSSLNLPHHIISYFQLIPTGAKDPTTGETITLLPYANNFIFVTEQMASPNGRVLMFNVSTWDGSAELTPTVIATGQDTPSKMTFIPDIQAYTIPDDSGNPVIFYGHAKKPAGYLYWTNYDPTGGQVVRVRLETNNTNDNLKVVGSPEVVATSLANPYDIIGPDDYQYIFIQQPATMPTTTTVAQTLSTDYPVYNTWATYRNYGSNMFDLLYVSSNLLAANGGNWYQIDLTKYSDTALTPADSAITSYLDSAVSFPLNGVIQIFAIIPTGETAYTQLAKVFKKDLFFNIFNFDFGSTNDSGIYMHQYNFNTDF